MRRYTITRPVLFVSGVGLLGPVLGALLVFGAMDLFDPNYSLQGISWSDIPGLLVFSYGFGLVPAAGAAVGCVLLSRRQGVSLVAALGLAALASGAWGILGGPLIFLLLPPGLVSMLVLWFGARGLRMLI